MQLSKMEQKLLLFFVFYTFLINCTSVNGNEEEKNVTETIDNNNSTGKNAKTYFIQLKKAADGLNSTYVQINHYKEKADEFSNDLRGKFDKMMDKISEIPENLKESIKENMKGMTAEAKKFADKSINLPELIDEDWSFNVNHNMYDLPNITNEIYEAMLENNKHNTVKNATTVKFFFETDTNLTSNIIKFNIDSLINVQENIVDAELHVYRLPRTNHTVKPNATENVVRLYQMTENATDYDELLLNTTEVKKNPDIHKLTNVIYISSNYAGWQVFKVKNVVENWKNGEDNLGFLISTVDSWNNVDSVDFAHRERHGGKYQPVLIIYLNKEEHKSADKKEVLVKSKHIRRLGEIFSKDFINPCRRHVWYVSFHEHGWNNFIIAPNGYMAYKCLGSCKSPLTKKYRNHGKLMSALLKDETGTCCVPDDYKSLLIMFYDRDSNVVIKEYDDMTVNSCGCR